MNIKYDDLLNIAIGKSRKETNWKNKELLWSDFLKKIENTNRTAETYNEYMASKKERQDEIKDVGGFVGGYINGGRRKAENIMNRQLITLDIDFGNIDLWETFTLIYGCAGAVYSTHKHSPTQHRLRLIIPLDRPVFADEYQAISRSIAGDLGIDCFDDSTYEPSRLMYWPSTAKDGNYIFEYEDAEWLKADDILNRYFDWRDVSSWPQSSRVNKMVARAVKKQGNPLDKEGLIGAFCRSYNIHEAIETFLSDVYTPCNIENRYTYIQGSTTAGVVTYDDIFAYSHHGTDPTGGKLCNAFDLVRIHKYGLKDEDAKEDTPNNRLPSYTAMTEFISKDNKTKRQLSIERLQEAKDDFNEVEIEEDAEWMSTLDTDKKGNIRNTINNAKIIFNKDRILKNVFALDEFENREIKLKELPWFDIEKDSKYMSDADDAEIRWYFESTYNMTTWSNLNSQTFIAWFQIMISKHCIISFCFFVISER